MMKHADDDVLLRCISGQARGEELLKVDTHMAECSLCRERFRALYYLSEHGESLSASWTAMEHGRAFRAWKLAGALEKTARKSPALAAGAGKWVSALREGAGIAVKVLVDRAGKVASAAEEALPPGYGFELLPTFAGVGRGDAMNRVEDCLKKSSRLLSQDRTEEALRKLLEAGRIDARSPRAAVSEILFEDKPVLQVVADSRRGRISVKLRRPGPGAPPGFALLLSREREEEVLAAPFREVEGEDYMVAEFEEVASGAYNIEVEPPAA
jgi:hypothetical protein